MMMASVMDRFQLLLTMFSYVKQAQMLSRQIQTNGMITMEMELEIMKILMMIMTRLAILMN